MTTAKRVWRRRLRWVRGRANAPRRLRHSRAICRRLDGLAAEADAKVVAVYAPIGAEVDPGPFVESFRASGGIVAYPRVVGTTRMELVPVATADQLVPRFKGILEPHASLPPLPLAEVDLLVVPGVGFDRHGNRLGQGMGYYDRLLSEASLSALSVGVGFGLQIVAAVPVESHDRPLDIVVTELGVARDSRWRD